MKLVKLLVVITTLLISFCSDKGNLLFDSESDVKVQVIINNLSNDESQGFCGTRSNAKIIMYIFDGNGNLIGREPSGIQLDDCTKAFSIRTVDGSGNATSDDLLLPRPVNTNNAGYFFGNRTENYLYYLIIDNDESGKATKGNIERFNVFNIQNSGISSAGSSFLQFSTLGYSSNATGSFSMASTITESEVPDGKFISCWLKMKNADDLKVNYFFSASSGFFISGVGQFSSSYDFAPKITFQNSNISESELTDSQKSVEFRCGIHINSTLGSFDLVSGDYIAKRTMTVAAFLSQSSTTWSNSLNFQVIP